METFYQNETTRLYCADVLDWALWYKAEIEAGRAKPFHAIVTDAPYSLGEPPPIVELLQAWLAGDKFDGFSPGFMSRVWDVMPGPQIWRALLDITYPGGYMFVFSGTRTADLLGIACRLGGWEPFDRIASFAWVQAQGMGKGANISKKLDASAVVPCPDCGGKGVFLPNMPQESMQAWADNQGLTLDEAMLVLSDQCETCDGTGQVVGVEREVVGINEDYLRRKPHGMKTPGATTYNYSKTQQETNANITAPATPLAQAFDGYNTGLAPKHEPILLFRRPREGRTFAQCAREFGSGGLNIGETRVNSGSPRTTHADGNHNAVLTSKGYRGGAFGNPEKRGSWIRTGETTNAPAGRWPPNVHYSHVPPTDICPVCDGQRQGADCPECSGVGMVGGCRRVGSKRVKGSDRPGHEGRTSTANIFNPKPQMHSSVRHADADGLETVADFSCVEGCPVRALDEMAGERKSGAISPGHKRTTSKTKNAYGERAAPPESSPASTGSASRFYPNHAWTHEIAERLAGETPFKYCAKASRGERDAGLAEFPETTECLTSLQGIESVRRCPEHDASIPSGSNCYTCGCKIIRTNVSKRQPQRNTHNCVKPLSLIKWLATLCRPPAQFSPRLCVPFCGSGSEAIGAILAGGWAEIHAIEREQEYVEIAAARLAWWSKWAKLTGKADPAEIRKLAEAAEAKQSDGQLDMFQTLKF